MPKTTGPVFIPYPPGIAAIPSLPGVLRGVARAAESIVTWAKSIAPVDEGDYRDHINAIWGIEDGTAKARVNADWFTSHWIEWGTVDTPTFAVLRRAAEAAGFTLSGDENA